MVDCVCDCGITRILGAIFTPCLEWFVVLQKGVVFACREVQPVEFLYNTVYRGSGGYYCVDYLLKFENGAPEPPKQIDSHIRMEDV